MVDHTRAPTHTCTHAHAPDLVRGSRHRERRPRGFEKQQLLHARQKEPGGTQKSSQTFGLQDKIGVESPGNDNQGVDFPRAHGRLEYVDALRATCGDVVSVKDPGRVRESLSDNVCSQYQSRLA